MDSAAADFSHRNGETLLARALGRARWSILWERLWPALAAVATAVGLFLAVSWFGIWLMLPPLGRAVGVGLFFGYYPANRAANLVIWRFSLRLVAEAIAGVDPCQGVVAVCRALLS